MTQEEYDIIEKRLRKGYELRQEIALTERSLQTMLSARKETDNHLPLISLEWVYAYHMDRHVDISDNTKRKIMDLITDDLAKSLEKLKKEYEEL